MKARKPLQAEIIEKIVELYKSLSAVDVYRRLKTNGVDITYGHVLAVLHGRVVVRSRSEANRTSVMKTTRACKHCDQSYVIINPAQVYCRTCCPSNIPQAYDRLKYYSLSHPEFESLIQKQNNCCAICENPLRHGGRTGLNVDHCHITGKVRGIVCHKCNMMIGFVDGEGWFNRLQQLGQYIAAGYM
jgi:hypothetical protein